MEYQKRSFIIEITKNKYSKICKKRKYGISMNMNRLVIVLLATLANTNEWCLSILKLIEVRKQKLKRFAIACNLGKYLDEILRL